MFSAEQSCWFVRKVICWRAVASIAWAVLLLPPITAVFVLLSRFSLLHPIQSVSECMSFLTSASAIFSFILLCGVIIMVGFLNLEYYTVIPTIACSKIALLGQLLHPRQFVNSLAHCIMGIIVAWCCAIAIGGRYETIAYPCTPDDGADSSHQMCLNEHHFILLLAGAFVGLSHSMLGVIYNMNYVPFLTVQQYKYLRFKGSLPSLVKCSATQALYSVRNYIVVYFFLGYIPKAWICKTLNLHLNSSAHPLDSIAGLLDLNLLYQLWVSAGFLLLTWHVTLLLFRIFVTEVYSFPVQSSFTEDAHQCLPKVITGKQPMILKFLALQDLALLAQHSPLRRSEVFSLSQPGGHPHNWNAISKECLSLLNDLTQRLIAYHDTVATNGRAKALPTGSERKTSSETSSTEDLMSPRPTFLMKTPASVFARSIVGASQSPLTAPFTSPDPDSPFASPALRRLTAPADPCSPWFGTVQSPHVMRRLPKLWSTPTDSQVNGSPPASPASVPSPKQEPSKPSLLAQFLQNRKEQVKHFLAKRVLIMYLFNKLPEASSQALFADSQAHIWALEGLTYLVQASFSEDQFGVVQTALPSILGCMLVLQEAVDRHFKLPHASSKPVRSASSLGDSTHKTLRFALRATLKTAIYRITTTFGSHLSAVQMSAEHRKRLQQFLENKE
ncbi:nucleoporin NDC1 isoform X1 [Pseudochaenichthys georgianus]|uniref:nucleoporin NDC1 isoform X1 n=1 Tax=Pseudochaenichthys georgianus TaxID=52239 RepID=UPI00146F59A4|nr:nucleoporin NDC1 isoform X1 [Pseudochaenichthys georgianus]